LHRYSANVIHRDLKPGNILVNLNCDLKICDFNLSRFVADDKQDAQLTEYVVTRWYRAPELLLQGAGYSSAIDMWSVGCILGEMMNRRPLFKVKDVHAHLHLILELFGTPCEEDIIASRCAGGTRQYLESLPSQPGVPLQTIFPTATPECIDLLSNLLVFNPSKRLTAEQCLAHEYFSELHDADDEPIMETQFPFADDWSFEDHPQSKESLRALVWNEIIKPRD
jgi:serine/threonine protein kinase